MKIDKVHCLFEHDLISRQAAIDAINHICPVDTEYDCALLDRVDVRCVLSDLPSAQPHWIPCSERLPKSGEQVFTYLFGDSPYIAWYNHKDKKWRTEEFELETDEEPKEWLPLPDPYEGEQE